MGRRRDHLHVTAQSPYSSGERANTDVAPAPLPHVLRYGGYKGEAAIHPALVDNCLVRARYRHSIVGLPGLFLRVI